MKVRVSEGGVLDDGTYIYHPGDLVELESAEAKKLFLAGKVKEPGMELLQPLQVEGDSDDLVQAIGTMSMDDMTLWTKSGAPKTEALSMIVGYSVGSEERDAAWQRFQERSEQ